MPIISDSTLEIETRLKSAFTKGDPAEYDYAEVWLDYITRETSEGEPFSEHRAARMIEWIKEITARYPNKLLILFRRLLLEEPTLSSAERIAVLNSLSGAPILLDLDIKSQREDLETIKNSTLQFKLITSYHNYSQTPNNSELEAILNDMQTYSPYWAKLACYCQTDEDAWRLMGWRLKFNQTNQSGIVLGMGPHGRITRVANSIWGNSLIFAPPKGEDTTAPNQLSLEELKLMLDGLAPFGEL